MDTLLINLAVAIVAAALGGLLANALRQPVIVGYIVAGLVIGPFALGLVSDVAEVQALAEIGIIFLLFALGLEFSLAEVRELGWRVLLAALLGIVLVVAVTVGLSFLWDLPLLTRIFLGCCLAISSTLVGLKLLLDRGEIESLSGRVTVSILVAQDLAVIGMLLAFDAAAGDTASLPLELGLAAGKAALVVAGVYLVGTRLVPWIMYRVGLTRSRELGLLVVVAMSLGFAYMTASIGLGAAFGAFAAGLMVSESDYDRNVLGQIIPLRDIFATLFFVSLGMLTDIGFVLENLLPIVGLAAAIIVGKSILGWASLAALGFRGIVPVAAALGLAQIGEFTFVLALEGLNEGIIDPFIGSLLLSSAILTLVAAPLVLRAQRPLHRLLARLGLGLAVATTEFGDDGPPRLVNHAVICGYGRVGRLLATALAQRRLAFVVIDLDPRAIRQLKQEGVPAIFGDATNPVVLERANIGRARLFAITVPDPQVIETALLIARDLQPRIDILARGHRGISVGRMRDLGAREVVQPEFEAALEMIRHSLVRFGVDSREVQLLLNTMRADLRDGSSG